MFWNISKLKQFWSPFPLKSLCQHHCHGCHLLTLCDPLQSLPRLWARGWSGLVAWQDAGRAALVRKRPSSGKLNTPKNFTLPSRTQSGQKGIHKQSTHKAPRTSLQTVIWVEVKGSLKGWEVGTSLILGTWSLFSPLLSTRLSSSQVFHLHCSLWGKRDIHFFLQLLVLRWWAQQFQFSDFCVCEMSQKR